MSEKRSRPDGGPTMFSRIAPRYDLLNRINSLGMDASWRRRLVRALAVPDDGCILDVATGTGDVAIAAAVAHPRATVVGVDLSSGMLERARHKVAAAGLQRRVRLMFADAQVLPFSYGSFDAACVAFGVRNVADRLRVLLEMTRVTRPGGRVAVLELVEPETGLFKPLARFHVHHVVPRVGALIAGSGGEYRYLQRSIFAFPRPEAFVEVMRQAGLEAVRVERLGFASTCLFVGTVAKSR